MINLFHDQMELITAARRSYGSGVKSLLLQSSTGSGKTYIASEIVRSAVARGKRVWFCVPRKDLLRQTSGTFDTFAIGHGYIASGWPYNRYKGVHIVSLQTVVKRLAIGALPDFLVVDEAHFGGKSRDTVIQACRASGAHVLGLSATPWDMRGHGMAHLFDDMVCGKPISWMIENGRLAKYRPFSPDRVDLRGVAVQNGDYNAAALDRRMRESKIYGNAVAHYKKHALGLLGVTFAPSVGASKDMADMYRAAGVPAAHMDGDTPETERVAIAKAFAKREILQLCNADLLTFGYDLSAVSGMDAVIECLSDCAPTKSLAKQMQKWGRGFRRDSKPHPFFDHGNNFETHGYPCDDRDWTIQPRDVLERKGSGERTIPVKRCGECFFSHRPAPKCPNCGFEYPYQGRDVEEVEAELREIEIRHQKKAKRMEVGQAKTISDLEKIAQERGYKMGWVYQQAKLKRIFA